MAYNSVGTPRFYVDLLSYLDAVGIKADYYDQGSVGASSAELFWNKRNPSSIDNMNIVLAHSGNDSEYVNRYGNIPTSLFTGKTFLAMLGHTLGDHDIGFRVQPYVWNPEVDNLDGTFGASQSQGYGASSTWETVNWAGSSMEYNGFSILRTDRALPPDTEYDPAREIDRLMITFKKYGQTEVSNITFKMGAFWVGKYFDMPHSPDLKLTLRYETGTKTIETKGGASLSNTMWRPPMWGDLGQWELSDPATPTLGQTTAHSSRRTWNLSFSFLDKTNTFPKYNALNRLIDQEETLPDDETLLTSDDFFSQVWNKVGTALPFIFQPDKDENLFAICKIANKSLVVKQVANQIYTIKLTLREVF